MASIKETFGTSTAITCTLAALPTTGARESTVIDNTTNLFLDAMVYVTLTTGVTTGSDNTFYVYAYGSEDGTNFTYPATGTDAAITIVTPTNLVFIKAIQAMGLTSTALKTIIGSIAGAFGGFLPRKWGIVIENKAGGTPSAGTCTYSGIYATAA